MRQAGEEYLASYDGFSSIDGSAEATTLDDASVDFVTAGQSFHWFEPESAAASSLASSSRRLDGYRLERSAHGGGVFRARVRNILERFGIDYKNVKDSYPRRSALVVS